MNSETEIQGIKIVFSSYVSVIVKGCHWLKCYSDAQRVHDKTKAMQGLFQVMFFAHLWDIMSVF